MKTKIYFLGSLLFGAFLYSQETKHIYYIEFKDALNKPKIIQQTNSSSVLSFNDQRLEVLKYDEAFSNFLSRKLKNTSLVEFKNGKDFDNFISLHQNRIEKYEKIDVPSEVLLLEKEEPKKILPENKSPLTIPYLYTPNDFTLLSVPESYTHLELINAREAWDYSKGDGVIVGITDSGFRQTHRELENKISTLPGQSVIIDAHGTMVSGLAGGWTDNNFGQSSIGFNNRLLVTDHSSYGSWNWIKQLSQNGARIINMSWLSSCSFIQAEQDAVNELYNTGTILAAAAGNSSCNSSYAQVFPASYKNVIAVSGVGHTNDLNSTNTENVKDVHYRNYATQLNRTQNNLDVDIVAPSFNIYGVAYADCDDCLGMGFSGTSFASPIVSGALSLMLSSNSCLSPLEAETILKLTSANIDHLPPNQIFAGLLGAGRLDAAKSTIMSWQMNPLHGGELLIENKNFTRWDFELLNSPEFIRIKNESFTQNANVVFRAKKGITLDTNTLLKPGIGKSHYLYVSNTNTCYSPPVQNTPPTAKESKTSIVPQYSITKKSDIHVYPVPAKEELFIEFNNSDINKINIKIFDANNRLISQKEAVLKGSSFSIGISELTKGIYFLDITTDKNSSFYKKIMKE